MRLLVALVFSCVVSVAAVAGTPELKLSDLNGKVHRLSDYHGKWVVVNYWAMWCPPCLREIPELERFYQKHKGGDAVVLGIDYEESDHKRLAQFVKDNNMSYPVLMGSPEKGDTLGPIPGLPTTFLVAPDGTIAGRKVGPVTTRLIENYINTIKAKGSE